MLPQESTDTQPIIRCDRLTKRFGSYTALKECNLSVASGCITGLLGPNGAGKTTLIRTLLGYQRPTSGSAKVCGYDTIRESIQVRRNTAYLPGEARLFRSMTGRGVIELFSGLSPLANQQRSFKVAERLQLNLSRRVMFMSTGMRQKLALAVVLGSNAPLLILDEPTANLDPTVRGEVMQLVREACDSGRTVLLSSHIFSDIDDTCDHVVIVRSGEVVYDAPFNAAESWHRVETSMNAASTGMEASWESLMQSQSSDWLADYQIRNQRLTLWLKGTPKAWMPWLATLPTDDLSIQHTGVRAIYERFHPSSSDSDKTEEV